MILSKTEILFDGIQCYEAPEDAHQLMDETIPALPEVLGQRVTVLLVSGHTITGELLATNESGVQIGDWRIHESGIVAVTTKEAHNAAPLLAMPNVETR